MSHSEYLSFCGVPLSHLRLSQICIRAVWEKIRTWHLFQLSCVIPCARSSRCWLCESECASEHSEFISVCSFASFQFHPRAKALRRFESSLSEHSFICRFAFVEEPIGFKSHHFSYISHSRKKWYWWNSDFFSIWCLFLENCEFLNFRISLWSYFFILLSYQKILSLKVFIRGLENMSIWNVEWNIITSNFHSHCWNLQEHEWKIRFWFVD